MVKNYLLISITLILTILYTVSADLTIFSPPSLISKFISKFTFNSKPTYSNLFSQFKQLSYRWDDT